VDLLLILLIVVAIASLGGWGYGTYYTRAPARTEVVAAPGWVSPIGVIGLIALIAVIAMFVTGWRPFVAVP
jgi:hypothetical protein